MIRQSAAWRRIYDRIKKRAGGKKAIVAVARRLLCVIDAMLRDGTNYDLLKVGEPPPKLGAEGGACDRPRRQRIRRVCE